ncbi:MAG: VOC family protein [Oscillochloridaceae bacterium umkhey_bin13]
MSVHWPTVGPEVRMTVDPLDLDAIIAELGTTPPPWTGLPSGTTIGHVHLQVGDLRAAEAFYVGVLGFSVMQRFGSSALFVAAGGYHHHLGLNTWAGPGAPPPPLGSLGLHHYTIYLPHQQALMNVQARVDAAGLGYEMTPAGLWLRDPAQHGLLLTASSV